MKPHIKELWRGLLFPCPVNQNICHHTFTNHVNPNEFGSLHVKSIASKSRKIKSFTGTAIAICSPASGNQRWIFSKLVLNENVSWQTGMCTSQNHCCAEWIHSMWSYKYWEWAVIFLRQQWLLTINPSPSVEFTLSYQIPAMSSSLNWPSKATWIVHVFHERNEKQ